MSLRIAKNAVLKGIGKMTAIDKVDIQVALKVKYEAAKFSF